MSKSRFMDAAGNKGLEPWRPWRLGARIFMMILLRASKPSQLHA